MPMPRWMEAGASGCVDLMYRIWPRNAPDREKLKNCRIVSHRGEHDNRSVKENTFAAFDPGDGIEDLRGPEFDDTAYVNTLELIWSW